MVQRKLKKISVSAEKSKKSYIADIKQDKQKQSCQALKCNSIRCMNDRSNDPMVQKALNIKPFRHTSSLLVWLIFTELLYWTGWLMHCYEEFYYVDLDIGVCFGHCRSPHGEITKLSFSYGVAGEQDIWKGSKAQLVHILKAFRHAYWRGIHTTFSIPAAMKILKFTNNEAKDCIL